jgi:hypothetical protein
MLSVARNMSLIISLPLFFLASASQADSSMRAYVVPIVRVLCVLAGLFCTCLLVIAGIEYTVSSGNPEKLNHAKRIIRNALLGLVLVLAATTLVAILNHAYSASGGVIGGKLPELNAIKPAPASNGLVEVLLKTVIGFLDNIIQTAATPFLNALSYFTTGTPLIASNTSVFNLWLVIVGMADALFVLVIALLGFHVMSYATLGLQELEFKHLLPQIGVIFLLINTSIFIIDGIISLSNALIHVLQVGLSQVSVWSVLSAVAKQASGFGLAALLVMIAFLVIAVILLVYYVGRLVTLYLGAVLSPLILLLWLLPSFRDFAVSAIKTYLVAIFVLFVHVVILELAASLLSGLIAGSPDHTADPIMALIVGVSTLVMLLKTQGVMSQFAYASIGPKTARKLSGQFLNSVSYAIARERERGF